LNLEKSQKDLSQLAAIVYSNSDKSIANNKNNIILKVIVLSIFKNDNRQITIYLLKEYIEETFGLIFTTTEIYNSIEANKGIFTLPHIFESAKNDSVDNLCIYLKANEYKKINNQITGNSLDNIINKFYNDECENLFKLDKVKRIIYIFLFNHFSCNLYNYKSLIEKNSNRYNKDFLKDIRKNISINYTDEKSRKIINSFINYEDDNKDKYIYYVITLAFEYSMTLNFSDGVTSSELLDRTIYLDSNIIFRALGLNGKKRKKRIDTFLNKCLIEGQKLIITNLTEIEFQSTLKHHTEILDDYKIKSSKSYNYIYSEDITSAYLEEKRENAFLNAEIFRSNIQTRYKRFKEKFGIDIDSIDEDLKKKDENNTLAKSLFCFKNNITFDESYDYLESYSRDIINTEYISKINKDEQILPSNIFVSADGKLLSWIKSKPNYINFAMLPSDWLSYILRFSSRSNDEYKSFVELLKISPINKLHFQPIHIKKIFDAIDSFCETPEQEEDFIRTMMENDIEKINEISNIKDKDKINKQINELLLKEMNIQHTKELKMKNNEIKVKDSKLKQNEIDKEEKIKRIDSLETSYKQINEELDKSKKINRLKKDYISNRSILIKYLIIFSFIVLLLTNMLIRDEVQSLLEIKEFSLMMVIGINLISQLIFIAIAWVIGFTKKDNIIKRTIASYRKYKKTVKET